MIINVAPIRTAIPPSPSEVLFSKILLCIVIVQPSPMKKAPHEQDCLLLQPVALLEVKLELLMVMSL